MWNQNPTGSLKYSPATSEEKIRETTSNAFLNLCRDKEGIKVAIKILDNYINDEQTNRQPILRRNSFPKE